MIVVSSEFLTFALTLSSWFYEYHFLYFALLHKVVDMMTSMYFLYAHNHLLHSTFVDAISWVIFIVKIRLSYDRISRFLLHQHGNASLVTEFNRSIEKVILNSKCILETWTYWTKTESSKFKMNRLTLWTGQLQVYRIVLLENLE